LGRREIVTLEILRLQNSLKNSRVLEDEDLEIPTAARELQKKFQIRKHPLEGNYY
jgi:hypothetical protein